MTRQRVHRALLLVVAVLVAGAIWGWWYLTAGRFPLAGKTSHDFGTVPIAGVTASFDHRFILRNRTDRTIVIETIRPGCGCTQATASTDTLLPDETVDIDVTLSLSRAGKKHTNIELVVSGFGKQSLWIEAVGRKETALSATAEHLPLVPGEPQTFVFWSAVQSSDAVPSAPRIAAPPGVDVTFGEWAAMTKRDPKTRRAARWRGRLTIKLVGDTLPAGAQLQLALGEATLAVGLSVRPTPPPGPESPPAPAPDDR